MDFNNDCVPASRGGITCSVRVGLWLGGPGRLVGILVAMMAKL